MSIVYAEPRYSLKNVMLSGFGDILGEVAKNWMQKAKMARLMEGNRDFFSLINQRNKELTQYPEFDVADFGSPVAAPASSNPLERAAEKAGVTGMAGAAFPGLGPQKNTSGFVKRDVNPLELIAYAYQHGGKNLKNMPSIGMQDVMFLTNALEESRKAPYYNELGERRFRGQDELHQGFLSKPELAPFAGSAYIDERAGASGLEALASKANTEMQKERTEKEFKASEHRTAVEEAKIPIMQAEVKARLGETAARLRTTPHDLRAQQEWEYWNKKGLLLEKANKGGLSPDEAVVFYNQYVDPSLKRPLVINGKEVPADMKAVLKSQGIKVNWAGQPGGAGGKPWGEILREAGIPGGSATESFFKSFE